MIIKNITSEDIIIKLIERVGVNQRSEISLKAGGSVEIIDRLFQVANLASLEGKIEAPEVNKKETLTMVPAEEINLEKAPETPIETKEVADKIPETDEASSLICDICGAEFGSARGLAAHKTRAHAE